MFRIGNTPLGVRKWLHGLVCALCVASCGIIKPVPVESTTAATTNIKDSLVINIKDSTIIHEVSRFKEYGKLLDTLRINGNRSSMKSWIDTTNLVLNGTLEEKPFEERIKYEYRDRLVEVHDTLVVKKEIPVELIKEKKTIPTWCWYSLILNILGLMITGFFIYLKIKKKTLKV